MKTTDSLTLEVKGSFQCRRNDEFSFLKELQKIAKTSEQLELVGIAVGKYYGCPVFEIEEKKYLLKDYSFEENRVVLTFFIPENLGYWQSVNEFLSSELEK